MKIGEAMTKKIVIGIISAVLIVYLAGVGYFNFYTLPNTFINEENRSFKDKSTALDRNVDSFTVTAVGKDGKEAIIPSESISYSVDIPKDARLNQNAFAWPTAFFTKDEYTVDYKPSWNDKKLTELLENSDLFKNVQEPINATIEKVEGTYQVTPQVYGNSLEMDKLKNSIITNFVALNDKIELDDEYKKPSVTKGNEELDKTVAKLNTWNTTEITFDLGEENKEVLTGDELIGILNKEDNYEPDQTKLRDYVKNLAIKYDTLGSDRTFNATGVGEVTVKGGIYGWQMNVDETTALLKDQIAKVESGTIKPVYNEKAMANGKNDIGSTYIELDLSRQNMWYYKDGELVVETPVVTGDPTQGASTPTGTYKVWSKEQNRRLRGMNFDGKTRYNVPVNYWMPINYTGIGIHDVNYRSSFGGGIYYGNGSHGCINTPYSKVKAIFESVELGTPVVIYYS